MSDKYENCSFVKEGHIATFTLNRPDRRNAYSKEIGDGLKQAVADVREDDEIRVFVITGAPEAKAFCGGMDVKAAAERAAKGDPGEVSGTPATSYKGIRKGNSWGYGETFVALYELDKPTIAAVNGFAVGMGMDLALVCDMRIVGESANFSMMYVLRGLIPDLGGFNLLPPIIGLEKTYDLVYTGRMVGGKEAKEIGLVLDCVPDDKLMSTVYEKANQIASLPPIAQWLDKHIIQSGLNMSYRDAMAHLTPYGGLVSGATEDSKEGFKAAAEKRKAVYQGK